MHRRFRFLLVMLLSLAFAFGGPFATSYAADEACMSQMADHGSAPVTADCDGCGGAPADHMQHDCCFAAGGVAIGAVTAPSAPISALFGAISGSSAGFRSVASSPGLQPPR
jgi:hypothetical protein